MLDSFLNKLIKGDCIEKMKELPDKSIDLIFADPPYNLQLQKALYRNNGKKFDGVNDDWDQFGSFEEYDKFCFSWLKECKRILKNDGNLWVIGSFQNIFRIGKIMQDLDYWILNDVLWIKTNPVPNFKGTRFTNAHETLIWASKNKNSQYTFHYKSMKAFNDDKQMRSDWEIPVCSGKQRIKKNGTKAHSAQKPTELLYRIIVSTSNVGDIILDPFMGSGTTGAVAKEFRRKFIGIEREEKYIKIATERIKKVKPIDKDYLNYDIEKKPPKVPFGHLIEKGYIKIGEKLYSIDKKFSAEVMANATLKNTVGLGSIHALSAKMLDRESNNGWTFWHLKNGTSINSLRENYIKEFYSI